MKGQAHRRELFEKLLIIKQGHPGSIFSMMDIVVTLYHGGFIRFDSKVNASNSLCVIIKSISYICLTIKEIRGVRSLLLLK